MMSNNKDKNDKSEKDINKVSGAEKSAATVAGENNNSSSSDENSKKKYKKKKRLLPRHFYTLTFRIVSYVFMLTVITLAISLSIMVFLEYIGAFSSVDNPPVSPVLLVILLLLVSSIIGFALAYALFSLSFKDLNKFSAAMNRVAKGDFTVTLPDSEDNYMHELNISFNAMVRSLNSIETLKKDFISDFSHEFKTPIASICGFAKLLKNPNLSDEEKEEYINIIITESNRLTQLSKNTLSMTKLENHETVYEKKNYLLDEQLRKCVLMFQTEIESKNIDLSLNGENIEYYGNEDLMQQMWINLISNAIKFTPSGKSIEITVEKTEDFCTVSVKDTGIGMDEETQKKIFEKFYQGDSSRSAAGNGLGLAIVKRIAELSNATITVDSKLGEGSTFTVKLPNMNFSIEKERGAKG